jgi:hypothetical protein
VVLVEVTRQGRREGTRCRSDLIPLCPHSKMSPTSTLRGLGLGETPLRRREAVTVWVCPIGIASVDRSHRTTPSQRQTIDRGIQRLVLHRSATPTAGGVAKESRRTPPAPLLEKLIIPYGARARARALI